MDKMNLNKENQENLQSLKKGEALFNGEGFKKVEDWWNSLKPEYRTIDIIYRHFETYFQSPKQLFEWVKASKETPPEGKLLNMNLSQGGPCLGHYHRANDNIHVEKYGNIERVDPDGHGHDFSIIYWLKPVVENNEPILKAENEYYLGKDFLFP